MKHVERSCPTIHGILRMPPSDYKEQNVNFGKYIFQISVPVCICRQNMGSTKTMPAISNTLLYWNNFLPRLELDLGLGLLVKVGVSLGDSVFGRTLVSFLSSVVHLKN